MAARKRARSATSCGPPAPGTGRSATTSKSGRTPLSSVARSRRRGPGAGVIAVAAAAAGAAEVGGAAGCAAAALAGSSSSRRSSKATMRPARRLPVAARSHTSAPALLSSTPNATTKSAPRPLRRGSPWLTTSSTASTRRRCSAIVVLKAAAAAAAATGHNHAGYSAASTAVLRAPRPALYAIFPSALSASGLRLGCARA
mmetsp:Transcript_25286/g.79374  ORF Transcript_25286/g.79374 Transcript_25286/m.79374 type:complete len:200 (-) Transcript_25286:109-708(-)